MPAIEEIKGRHSVDRIVFPMMNCMHRTEYIRTHNYLTIASENPCLHTPVLGT